MEESTCANFAQVADNGKTYQYKFYPLSAIIAVGYRTNEIRNRNLYAGFIDFPISLYNPLKAHEYWLVWLWYSDIFPYGFI